jgi:hypothetical protein
VRLLIDEGSANGTFLNGVRLEGRRLIELRPGDAIEVGDTRLAFGAANGVPVSADAPPELVVPIEELLREGLSVLGGDEAGRFEVMRAFAEVAPDVGVARYLDRILAQVRAERGAAFVRSVERRELVLVASRGGTDDASLPLRELADRVLASGEGRVVKSAKDRAERTVAAVPFSSGERSKGVLVIERGAGPRFDRTELARLAVMGERLAWARSLRAATRARDTRTLGFDA